MTVIGERKLTAFGGRGASRNRGRIKMTEIDEGRGSLIL
jgi:hypothetical protein